jgi:dCMP deaminase
MPDADATGDEAKPLDPRPKRERPSTDEYYMRIAMAARQRANCLGNRVGAVIVFENRIVATGYNGVPEGMQNCEDGGCFRCSRRHGEFESGTGYDLCICVHAEQNALLAAARHGISVRNAALYSTMRPCFGCTKELLQAGIDEVYFIHDWRHPRDDVQNEFERIRARVKVLKRLHIDDPEADWALSSKPPEAEDTGHTQPD